MVNEREIILDALMEILEKKQYSHYVMKQMLDKYAYLDKVERSFIKRVTEGTIERMMTLDYVIDQVSKTKVKKMKPLIRTLMRMSTYQLLFMEKIPDSAVCNEAVKLAGKRGFSTLKGFINGVLRNIARNKAEISFPKKEEDIVSFLSVAYSTPIWMVEYFLARFGPEKTEQIVKATLESRPVTIRISEQISAEEKQALLDEMSDMGVEYTQDEKLAYAYRLEHVDSVDLLPGFFEGKIMVQDAGSMEIVEVAKVKSGDYVVDVCGAPGGKALHAADKLGGRGQVIVRDLSERKVALIEENIQRSGFSNIEAQCHDATVFDSDLVKKADVVIADLPCSGLGVMGRKGDIKYRVQKEDISDIATLQKQILDTVWDYVKVGGRLVYSTCTITEEENEQNTAYILEKFPFKKIFEQTLFPGNGRTDGFYMAVFERM